MISQVLVYECDYCGHTESEKVACKMGPLSHLVQTVPHGWTFVFNKLACPNHMVIVKTVEGNIGRD